MTGLISLARSARAAVREPYWTARIRTGTVDWSAEGDDLQKILDDLGRWWGNPRWQASSGYLTEAVTQARRLRPALVLECGSGLSTVVMASVVARWGGRVASLEQDPRWTATMRMKLSRLGIGNAIVYDAPLVDHGEFDWYRLPGRLLDEGPIGLVLCDGPPGDTRGGRRGLVPVMGDRLAGAVVLLDDSERDSEQDALREWAAAGATIGADGTSGGRRYTTVSL